MVKYIENKELMKSEWIYQKTELDTGAMQIVFEYVKQSVQTYLRGVLNV